MLKVGKISASHGLKGQVKVASFLINPSDIFKYKLFDKDLNPITIKNSSNLVSKVFICSVNEARNLDEAKVFVGKELFINEEDLPDLKENEFYEYKILGTEVFSNNKVIGKVSRVLNIGSKCYLEIELDGKDLNHLAEFNEENFPAKLNSTPSSKFVLHINDKTLDYLKH